MRSVYAGHTTGHAVRWLLLIRWSLRWPPTSPCTCPRFGFELTDGRAFLLRYDRGSLTLEARAAETDCRIRCAMDTCQQILHGEINLLTAFMRGEAHVSGDMEAAKRLYRYLRLAKAEGDRP
jgi:putative sterol carrier protein